MKIFNNNLNNNPKTVALRIIVRDTGKIKYIPSFSKEWKNIIYSYNKNNIKNIPINDENINKIIKSYFNIHFKREKFINSYAKRKFISLKKRRNFLRRIYVSNAEIKHTNNKAIITLYTVNREKKILKEKYLKINEKVRKFLVNSYFLFYKSCIAIIYKKLNKRIKEDAFKSDEISKRKFLNSKLEYLNKFINLKYLYIKKI